jgi:hypothetical protein
MLITKGELLTILGTDGDKFTAFMLDPASFGVAEPYLSKLKVAKQKLDWTTSVETDLPEIAELIDLLLNFGIFTDQNIIDINSFDGIPNYNISVIAQDDITDTNIYGAVQDGSSWVVKVDFTNITTNKLITENFVFDTPPEDQLRIAINNHIKLLKTR